MIDHTGLLVSDLERSRRFYATALAPLGYCVRLELPQAVGIGADVRTTRGHTAGELSSGASAFIRDNSATCLLEARHGRRHAVRPTAAHGHSRYAIRRHGAAGSADFRSHQQVRRQIRQR